MKDDKFSKSGFFDNWNFDYFQTALNTYGNILYMDSDVRICSSKITKHFYPKSGILTWPTKHPISSLTHPKMYEYFHVTVESFFFLPLVQTTHLIIRNTKEIRDNVMLPWVQCALTRDCICPIGLYAFSQFIVLFSIPQLIHIFYLWILFFFRSSICWLSV